MILAAHEILEVGTAMTMARASGFRNSLVHEYIEVRDDLVRAYLSRTEDIRLFVAEVAAWMARP